MDWGLDRGLARGLDWGSFHACNKNRCWIRACFAALPCVEEAICVKRRGMTGGGSGRRARRSLRAKRESPVKMPRRPPCLMQITLDTILCLTKLRSVGHEGQCLISVCLLTLPLVGEAEAQRSSRNLIAASSSRPFASDSTHMGQLGEKDLSLLLLITSPPCSGLPHDRRRRGLRRRMNEHGLRQQ